jgi:hypothetical protein
MGNNNRYPSKIFMDCKYGVQIQIGYVSTLPCIPDTYSFTQRLARRPMDYYGI